jgi:mRNA interferase HigB
MGTRYPRLCEFLGEDTEVFLGEASGCRESLKEHGIQRPGEPTGEARRTSRLIRTASILRNNRAVFNVKGNAYRLVVAVKYEFQVVYIRFIGTHSEYDKIKAEEV